MFLNFNVALAPGAIMTALLMHRGMFHFPSSNLSISEKCLQISNGCLTGISSSIVGAFSGLCSVMGLVATFISSSLVKRVGILKVGSILFFSMFTLLFTIDANLPQFSLVQTVML